MIDLHCHVLAGIDDGPSTIESSVAIARAAAAAGIGTLVATPHVSWRYPNEPDTIARSVSELNEHLAAAEPTVDVRAGAEIAMTRVGEIEPAQLSRLGLGGSSWLLIEPPFTPVASGLDMIVADLQRRGHRIVLAHPERCPAFHRDPRLLGSLVHEGAIASITAGSLVGSFGETVRRFALQLAQDDLIHNVTSDAHDDSSRPPGMRLELERSGLGPLAEWLTQAVPAAVLTDQEIPPRPTVSVAPRGKSAWWHRRG